MTKEQITQTEAGLAVSGKIGFESVVALRRRGERLIDQLAPDSLTVELSGVTSCDVSGLSLLLCWMRAAKRKGKSIRFTELPNTLHKLAKVCGLSSFFEN